MNAHRQYANEIIVSLLNGSLTLCHKGSDELYEYAKNYRANQSRNNSDGGGADVVGNDGGSRHHVNGTVNGSGGGGGNLDKIKEKLVDIKRMSLDVEGSGGVRGGGGSGGVNGREADTNGSVAYERNKKKAISKQGSLDTKIEDIIGESFFQEWRS